MISIIVAFQDQKTPSSLTVITSSKISRSSSMVKGPTAASGFGDGIEEAVTRFEKKGKYCWWRKSYTTWDIYHTNWCRISSINRMKPLLDDFLGNRRWVEESWIRRGCNPDAGHHHQWVIWRLYISWKLQSQQIKVLQADFLGWNLIRPFSKMLHNAYIRFFLR